MSQLYEKLEPEELSLNFTHSGTVELNPSGFYTAILELENNTPCKQQTAPETQFLYGTSAKLGRELMLLFYQAVIFKYIYFHSCPIVSDNTEQYQCNTEQQLEAVSFVLPCLTLSHLPSTYTVNTLTFFMMT